MNLVINTLDQRETMSLYYLNRTMKYAGNSLFAVTMCEGDTILPEDLMLEQASVKTAQADNYERDQDQSLDTYIEDIEKHMLEDALKKARYNKTRAADLLGISFRSLRYKLKKFEID